MKKTNKQNTKERALLERITLRDYMVRIFICVKGFHKEEGINLSPTISNDLNCSNSLLNVKARVVEYQ